MIVRFVAGLGEQRQVAFTRRCRTAGQFDRGQEAFIELREVAFQEHGHVAVVEPGERTTPDQLKNESEEPDADRAKQDRSNRDRWLEEPIDCETQPKRSAKPSDAGRHAMKPRIATDPTA